MDPVKIKNIIYLLLLIARIKAKKAVISWYGITEANALVQLETGFAAYPDTLTVSRCSNTGARSFKDFFNFGFLMNSFSNQSAQIGRIMQNISTQNYPAATLYVLATPIGNTGDITLRSLHVLSLADAVVCEDTRTTGLLLSQYGISKELIASHQHNEHRISAQIVERLSKGERIALVTDAGTPAVSDPGSHLVDAVLSAGFRAAPIPGASALVSALSVSGLRADRFHFAGFMPSRKAAREAVLESLSGISATLVFYEAPHRIVETLESLVTVFKADRQIVIARELTKLFEEVHRCLLSEAAGWIEKNPNHARGEFVLIVEGAKADVDADESEAVRILSVLLSELSVSQAANLASRISGIKKKRLYEYALKIRGAGD